MGRDGEDREHKMRGGRGMYIILIVIIVVIIIAIGFLYRHFKNKVHNLEQAVRNQGGNRQGSTGQMNGV